MKKLSMLFLVFLMLITPIHAQSDEANAAKQTIVTREEALAEIPIDMHEKLSADLIELYILGRTGGPAGNPTSIFEQYISYFDDFESFLNVDTLSNYVYTGRYLSYEEGHDFYIRDFSGIEHFNNIRALFFVLETKSDLDFIPLELLKQPTEDKYDPNTGTSDPNQQVPSDLVVNYWAKPFKPLSHGGKATVYEQEKEMRFMDNYERLIQSLSTLTFTDGKAVYLSNSFSGTILPVLTQYQRFNSINAPYTEYDPTKTLQIVVPYDTIGVTQHYTIEDLNETDFRISYTLPFETAEHVDPIRNPEGELGLHFMIEVKRLYLDGVEVVSEFGFDNQYPAMKTIAFDVSKEDYYTYLSSYEASLTGISEDNPDVRAAEMSHNALMMITQYASSYSSASLKMIPHRLSYDVFYTLGAINPGERVEVIGTLPTDMEYIESAKQYYTLRETLGENVFVPNLSLKREGYTHVGWYDYVNQKMWDFNTDKTATDLFLEAVWVPNDEVESVYVDVVFDAQNGQPTTTQRILKGSTVTQPSDPIQDHFVFSRWSAEKSGPAWEFQTPVQESMTLYGQWDTTDVTVTFVDAETRTDVEVPYNTAVAPGDVPKTIKPGSTFKEWNTQVDGKGSVFNTDQSITEDVTVYAIYDVNKYNVKFVDDGTETNVVVEHNKQVPADAVPKTTKPGSTFKEWNTQVDGKGSVFNTDQLITEDVTVYAIYTQDLLPVQTHTVTFVDGVIKTPVVVATQTKVPHDKVPQTHGEGKTFLHWNLKADGSGDVFDLDQVIDSDQVVYAIYAEITKPNPEIPNEKLPETGVSNQTQGLVIGIAFVITGTLLAIYTRRRKV